MECAESIPEHPSMASILKHKCHEQEMAFCEEHCAKCIYQWCPISSYYNKAGHEDINSPSDVCPCIDCPNFCGFRMHKCKVEEHLSLLCSLQIVPCLCSAYGCVHKMPRHLLAQHLEDCPASVIHCTVEWNRWPRFSGEKYPCLNPSDFPPRHYTVPGERINLVRDLGKTENNTYSVFISNGSNSCYSKSCNHFSHLVSWNSEFMDEGLLEKDLCMSQFDLALAARDQNILESGLRVSKHTRRALRNSLTERYPALPMPSTFTHCPHRCGSEQPCSSCSTNSTNSTVLEEQEPQYGPPGLSSTVCGRLFTKQTSPDYHKQNANKSLYQTDIPQPYIPPHPTDHPKFEINGAASSQCAQSNLDDVAFLEFIKESGLLDTSLYGSLHLGLSEESSILPVREDRSSMMLNNLPEAKVCSGAGDEHDPVTPLTETMARAVTERSIQVDTTIESYPRYQHKPRAMYTFLCASDVRRREFPDHYQLHCDVISHVDGWIEQRCPLAYRGCPFVMRRLRPNSKDCSLVYAPRFSSFSLRYSPITVKFAANESHISRIKLTDLPNEVLIRIFNFVDNFTMHSLCRTCVRFRSICAYLLPTRGSVSLLWQRRKLGESKQWFCAEKVWFFTFGTDSISKWCPVDTASHEMHEHLADCEFFDRCVSQVPYKLIDEELPFEKLSGASRRKKK